VSHQQFKTQNSIIFTSLRVIFFSDDSLWDTLLTRSYDDSYGELSSQEIKTSNAKSRFDCIFARELQEMFHVFGLYFYLEEISKTFHQVLRICEQIKVFNIRLYGIIVFLAFYLFNTETS